MIAVDRTIPKTRNTIPARTAGMVPMFRRRGGSGPATG